MAEIWRERTGVCVYFSSEGQRWRKPPLAHCGFRRKDLPPIVTVPLRANRISRTMATQKAGRIRLVFGSRSGTLPRQPRFLRLAATGGGDSRRPARRTACLAGGAAGGLSFSHDIQRLMPTRCQSPAAYCETHQSRTDFSERRQPSFPAAVTPSSARKHHH